MTTKTLGNWLSDPEYNIRRSYRDLIHTAYENVAVVPADPIPNHVKNGQFEISGVVRTGDDERHRGRPEAAPLRIDGRRGHWDEIEELWLAGELTDDEFEDHFVDDVIVEDIGEGTDGWDFPGSRTPSNSGDTAIRQIDMFSAGTRRVALDRCRPSLSGL
ncbi:hypothetical protein [Streptomyces flavidovirens]